MALLSSEAHVIFGEVRHFETVLYRSIVENKKFVSFYNSISRERPPERDLSRERNRGVTLQLHGARKTVVRV